MPISNRLSSLLGGLGGTQPFQVTDPMQAPKVLQGLQQQGALSNLQQLASQTTRDPAKQAFFQANQDVSDIGKVLGFYPQTSRETDAQRKQKLWLQYQGELTKINQIANGIRLKLSQGATPQDVVPEVNEIEEIKKDVPPEIRKMIDDQLFDIWKLMEQAKRIKAQEKKGSLEQAKSLDSAINNWKKDNTKELETIKNAHKLRVFAEEAGRGNPVAIKNLMAASSKLGSDEALSDKEMEILVAGDIDAKWQSLINKAFGTGSSFGPDDVRNAISMVNRAMAKIMGSIGPVIEEDSQTLQEVWGGDINTIQKRMNFGLPKDWSEINVPVSFKKPVDRGVQGQSGTAEGLPASRYERAKKILKRLKKIKGAK